MKFCHRGNDSFLVQSLSAARPATTYRFNRDASRHFLVTRYLGRAFYWCQGALSIWGANRRARTFWHEFPSISLIVYF